MAYVNANLTWNRYFAIPGGYPFRLWQGGFDEVRAFLRKQVTAVSATVSAEQGTIDIWMGIYEAPISLSTPIAITDADGGDLVDEAEIEGLGTTEQTLILTMPTLTVAVPYVLRLKISNPSQDEESTIPYGMTLHSMRATLL